MRRLRRSRRTHKSQEPIKCGPAEEKTPFAGPFFHAKKFPQSFPNAVENRRNALLQFAEIPHCHAVFGKDRVRRLRALFVEKKTRKKVFHCGKLRFCGKLNFDSFYGSHKHAVFPSRVPEAFPQSWSGIGENSPLWKTWPAACGDQEQNRCCPITVMTGREKIHSLVDLAGL